MTEFKCILNKEKTCNDCDECILCFKCAFLKKRIDNFEVICKLKGQVDLHSSCHLYQEGDNE